MGSRRGVILKYVDINLMFLAPENNKKPLSQIRFNLNSDNGFCFVHFPVTVADVDIMVEMGGVEPPS